MGPLGLELRGGTGTVFFQLGRQSYPAISGLFQLIGESTLFKVEGNAYPIEVSGTVRVINDASLAPALFISTAPPLNLDPLLAQMFKSLECAVFASGTCVLTWAGVQPGDTTKGPGGVCK